MFRVFNVYSVIDTIYRKTNPTTKYQLENLINNKLMLNNFASSSLYYEIKAESIQ